MAAAMDRRPERSREGPSRKPRSSANLFRSDNARARSPRAIEELGGLISQAHRRDALICAVARVGLSASPRSLSCRHLRANCLGQLPAATAGTRLPSAIEALALGMVAWTTRAIFSCWFIWPVALSPVLPSTNPSSAGGWTRTRRVRRKKSSPGFRPRQSHGYVRSQGRSCRRERASAHVQFAAAPCGLERLDAGEIAAKDSGDARGFPTVEVQQTIERIIDGTAISQ